VPGARYRVRGTGCQVPGTGCKVPGFTMYLVHVPGSCTWFMVPLFGNLYLVPNPVHLDLGVLIWLRSKFRILIIHILIIQSSLYVLNTYNTG
jgi:hypothetical protein